MQNGHQWEWLQMLLDCNVDNHRYSFPIQSKIEYQSTWANVTFNRKKIFGSIRLVPNRGRLLFLLLLLVQHCT